MSSTGEVLPGPLPGTVHSSDSVAQETKPVYKSWKKKYRKMKLVFDQKMRDGDQLFKAEQKAHELTRRLAEDNDQLLEILLDVNDSVHIPSQHRFNLSSVTSKPPSASAVPSLEPDLPPKPDISSHARFPELQEAAKKLAAGRITADEYASFQKSLLEDLAASHVASKPKPATAPKPFSALLSVPHVSIASVTPAKLPEDLTASPPPDSYISPSHEDDYLFALDNSLSPLQFSSSENRATGRLSASKTLAATTAAERERDRDFALRNPVSVYNWLRRHQPQVFLQDNEGIPEKTGQKSSRGAGKRASTAAAKLANAPQPPSSEEFIDDDGIVWGGHGEAILSGKKRKIKDDDPVYRPKGGHHKKRKRETDVGGSSKKKRVSGSSEILL